MSATYEELARRVNRNKQRLDDLPPPEISPDLISPFMALPALRGFWPLSSRDENGDAYDLSGQGRTLTDSGNPDSNFYYLAPYVSFTFEQKLYRGDEAGLDILGTETYVDSGIRGLTMGGWFWIPYSESTTYLMEKFQVAGNQRSYQLTGARFAVSVDGTAETAVALVTPDSAWCFVVGRFTPSTELAAWVNMTKTTNEVDIPASIFDGSAEFHIGVISVEDTRASLCFLCAAALGDAIVSSLFNQTKAAFRV